MKLYTFIQILIIATFIVSCGTAKYNSQVAEDVNFNEFETFAILPENDTNDFSVYDSEIVRDKTMKNVKAEMMQRGYDLDTENPDLLVMIHYMFSREKETIYDPIYPTYDYYTPGFVVTPWNTFYYVDFRTIPRIYGDGFREVKYTEGTIVIDVINAGNSKLLWRGWSEDRVDPLTFTEDIRIYIENIFDNYPIKEDLDRVTLSGERENLY